MPYLNETDKLRFDINITCSLLSLISTLSWTDIFFEKENSNLRSTIKLNSLYILFGSPFLKSFVIQIILEFTSDVNLQSSSQLLNNNLFLNQYLQKFHYYYFKYGSYYHNTKPMKTYTELNMLAIDSLVSLSK